MPILSAARQSLSQALTVMAFLLLAAGFTGSAFAETVKPVSVLTNITKGAGSTYVIRGESHDADGSGVRKMEVSYDGGSTWSQAKPANTGITGRVYYNSNFTGECGTISDGRTGDANIDYSWGTNPPGTFGGDVTYMDGDSFSVRWDGYLWVETAGDYTFYLTVNDAGAVIIDGATVLNPISPGTYQSVPVTLSRGTHTIRVNYVENITSAYIKLEWESASVTRQVIPESCLSDRDNHWLWGLYCSSSALDCNAVAERYDSTIDFDWGDSWFDNNDSPFPALIDADTFSAMWLGYLWVPTTGTYTFYAEADDGVRLYVDDDAGASVTVIDSWVNGSSERSGSISLSRGWHVIVMEYYENTGGAKARLRWASPGITKQIIPASNFLWPGGFEDWAYTFTPPADGVYTIKWRATDVDGNVETPSGQAYLKVDTTAPGIGVSSPANGAYLTVASPTISGTASDAGTGVALVEVSTDDGATWSPIASTQQAGGLRGTYFNNRFVVGAPALTRIDSTVDFAWGTGSPDASINADEFSARWEGWFYADHTETYNFSTGTDDGVKLWIDGVIVSNQWKDMSGLTWNEISRSITTGYHSIKMEYYNLTGNADARLLWKSASQTGGVFAVIPADHLYSSPFPVASPWSYTWSGPADGVYSLKARATDMSGNANTTTATVTVTVDNTIPVCALTKPSDGGVFGGTTYEISGTASDPSCTAVTGVEVSMDGGTAWVAASDISGNGSWSSWKYDWTLPADGSYTVRARSTDTAGNVSTVPVVNVIVDSSIPSSVITDPVYNPAGVDISGTVYTVTGTAETAGGGGIQYVEVSTDGGSTWSTATGTTSWSYDWTVPTEGTYTIKSRATTNSNIAENVGVGNSVRVNFTEPTTTITFPNITTMIVKDASCTITGTATDPGINPSGVKRVEVSLDGGTTWDVATGTTSWSYTTTQVVPYNNSESFTVMARAVDNVDLTGPADTVTGSNIPRPIVTGIRVYHTGNLSTPAGELSPDSVFAYGAMLDARFVAAVDWNNNPHSTTSRVQFVTNKGAIYVVPTTDASAEKTLNVGDTNVFAEHGWALKAFAVADNGMYSDDLMSDVRLSRPFWMPPWLPTDIVHYDNPSPGEYDRLTYGLDLAGIGIPGTGVSPNDIPDSIPGFGGKAMNTKWKVNFIAKFENRGRFTIGGGFGAGPQWASATHEAVPGGTSTLNPLNPNNTVNPIGNAKPGAAQDVQDGKLLKAASVDITGYIQLAGVADYKRELRMWDWGGQIKLGADFNWSYTQPVYPWGIPMYFKLSINANAAATFALLDWKTDLHFEGDLEADVYLRGAIGVGVDGVVSAEGFLGGGAHIWFHYPNPAEIRDLSLYVKAGVKGKFMFIEKEIELYNGRWSLIGGEQPASVSMAPMGMGLGMAPMLTDSPSGSIRLMSRDYAKKPEFGTFNARPMLMPIMNAVALPGMSDGTIQYGVFPMSDPDISSGTADEMHIAWLQDNLARDSINRTEVVFSKYDGASWTPPGTIEDDGTADFAPEMLTFGNSSSVMAICAWQDCNAAIAEPAGDLASILAAANEQRARLDISVAVYDGTDWSAPVALTANDYLDMPPMLSGDSFDDVLMVWLANESLNLATSSDEDGLFIEHQGSASKPNSIWFARWDGSFWSAPQKIASLGELAGSTMLKTDMAYDGTTGVLVLSVDGDGDNGTTVDQEVYYVAYDAAGSTWSLPVRLTSDTPGGYLAVGSDGREYRCIQSHTADTAAGYLVVGNDLREYRCIKHNTAVAGLVIGSDGNEYRCLQDHTATAASEPGTGAEAASYWEATGGAGAPVTWSSGTQYAASNEPGYGVEANDCWEATGALGTVVTWSDGAEYYSSGENEPGTGASYDQFWEPTGNTGLVQTWTAGAGYVDHKGFIDANPHVDFDSGGNSVITWLDGDDIVYTTNLDPAGRTTIASPGHSAGAADFKTARSQGGRIAIVWPDASLEGESSGSNLFITIYDPASSTWGEYRQMTFNNDSERYMTMGFLGEDVFVTAYDRMNIGEDIQTLVTDTGETMDIVVPVDNGTDLAYVSYTIGGDLAMLGEGLFIDPPNPQPGTAAEIAAIVANLGDLAVSSTIPAKFYNGDPNNGGTLIGTAYTTAGLRSGEMEMVLVNYTIPPTTEPITIFAVVDPDQTIYAGDEDRNRANDIISATGMIPDIAIEYAGYTRDEYDVITIDVRVTNTGALPSASTDITFKRVSTGEVLHTASIPSLEPGEVYEVPAFDWDASAIEEPFQDLTFTLDIAGATTDFNRANNFTLMTVQLGNPNISFSADIVNFGKTGIGFTDEVVVTITNSGNADLEISAIPAPPVPFGLDAGFTDGLILGPEGSHDITVSFTPSAVSSSSYSLIISSNDPDQPTRYINLSGQGALPEGAVTINSGALFTNMSGVVLSPAAEGYGNTVTGMQFSNYTSGWSTLQNYTSTAAWTLTSGDGQKTVYVRYVDDKGNVSNVYSDDITLDMAPSTVSILSPGDGDPIKGTSRGIFGTASDDTSGVSLVQVSFDGGTSWHDASGKSNWSYNWSPLPADGDHTVQARAFDTAGNAPVQIAGITVTVDNTEPTCAVGDPGADAVLDGASYTVSGTAGDSGSGVNAVEISTDGGVTWLAATDTSGDGSWSTWSYGWTLPADGPRTLVSRTADKAGNVKVSATVGVMVDNDDPTSAVTGPAEGYAMPETLDGYLITGTASDGLGKGVTGVEVSTDGGSNWSAATDTSGDGSWSAWSHDWQQPVRGSYTLVSRATDGNGHTEPTGTGVSVTVDNHTPSIDSSPSLAATEDAPYSYDADASDHDLDTLTYVLTLYPDGMTIDDVTGAVGWTPTNGQVGDNDVTVEVSDANGGTDTQSFTVTVENTNDTPGMAGVPDQTVEEGTPFATFDLDDYGSDIDVGDSLTYGYSGNTDLAVTIGAGNVVTVTAPADWNGSETVTFRATDLSGAFAEDAAKFTATNTNDTPTMADIPGQTVDEGNAFATFDLDDYGSDIDPGDALTYSYSGNTDLAVTIGAGNVVTVTAPLNWNGSETVTFRATDIGGLFAEDSAAFEVTPVNDAPVLSFVEDKSVNEDEILSFTLESADVDGPAPTFSCADLPAGAALDPDTGEFGWTPNYDQAGVYAVTFEVSDGELADSQSVNIDVVNVNRAPSVTAIVPAWGVYSDDMLDLQATASDPDSGDAVTLVGYEYSLDSAAWNPIADDDTPDDPYHWNSGLDNVDVYLRARATDGNDWGAWFHCAEPILVSNSAPVVMEPFHGTVRPAAYLDPPTPPVFAWDPNSCEKFKLFFSAEPFGRKALKFNADNRGYDSVFSPDMRGWNRITKLGREVWWWVVGYTADKQTMVGSANLLTLYGGFSDLSDIPATDIESIPAMECDPGPNVMAGLQLCSNGGFIKPVRFPGSPQPVAGGVVSLTPDAKPWSKATKPGPILFWRFIGRLPTGETTYSETKSTIVTGGPVITSHTENAEVLSPTVLDWDADPRFIKFEVGVVMSDTNPDMQPVVIGKTADNHFVIDNNVLALLRQIGNVVRIRVTGITEDKLYAHGPSLGVIVNAVD